MDSSEEGFLLFKPGRHKPLKQYRHMFFFPLCFSLAPEYWYASRRRNASIVLLMISIVYETNIWAFPPCPCLLQALYLSVLSDNLEFTKRFLIKYIGPSWYWGQFLSQEKLSKWDNLPIFLRRLFFEIQMMLICFHYFVAL